MIFALRARPPCTKRRLSLREPKGYSSSSTPKMFNYWFIIPRFRRLSTGKLENFSLFVPFSGAGRRAPLCGAGMRPHFLWVLPKENGRARSKEKRFSRKWPSGHLRRIREWSETVQSKIRMTSAECALHGRTNNLAAANCDILTNLLGAGRKVSASIIALPASSQGGRDSRKRLSSRLVLQSAYLRGERMHPPALSEAGSAEIEAPANPFTTPFLHRKHKIAEALLFDCPCGAHSAEDSRHLCRNRLARPPYRAKRHPVDADFAPDALFF